MRFTEALEYQNFTLKPSGIYVSNHHPQSPFLSSPLNLKMGTSVPTEILFLASLLLFSVGASDLCDQRRGCVPLNPSPRRWKALSRPHQFTLAELTLHVLLQATWPGVLITLAILVPCRWPCDFWGISQHKSKEDICETEINLWHFRGIIFVHHVS